MRFLERFYFLFKPYIAIFFLDNIVAGAVVALVTFLVPSVAILGLVSVLSTIALANFLQIRDTYLKEGFYIYNSLLVGMGIGYFYGITLLSIVLAIFFGLFTFVLTFSLNRIFSSYSLPILSLPFAIVSILFYLASYKYTALFSNILQMPSAILELHIHPYVDEFLRSFGTILFLPYPMVGLILFMIVLYFSRILALLAILGFVAGVSFHAFLLQMEGSFSLYNFNYILIAMALGGVFLVPHLKSYIIAIIAVIVSVFIIDATEVFFYTYNIPLYTIPFNTVVILFLLLLVTIGYRYYNYAPKSTPEESLLHHISYVHRFKSDKTQIGLPFLGRWKVYQAFDGKWTHKGELRYAYDFVKSVDGKLFRGEGNLLQEYFSYGEPVVSPVDGWVVDLVSDVPDNIIGEVDRINVWGNYLLIRSTQGFYVLIAHLMQHSINVKVGEYVKKDRILAKCGNSGYSPLPHIHIQVQKNDTIGSATTPFVFEFFHKNGELYFYELPKENEEIENLPIDPLKKMQLDFVLDDRFVYDVDGEEVVWQVKMNSRGEFYFDDGKNRLYFYTYAKSFYFYDYEGGESLLKELFRAAPRIPLVHLNAKFTEPLPITLFRKVWFILGLSHRSYIRKVEYELKDKRVISRFGEVKLSSYHRGFEVIKTSRYTARLKEER